MPLDPFVQLAEMLKFLLEYDELVEVVGEEWPNVLIDANIDKFQQTYRLLFDVGGAMKHV